VLQEWLMLRRDALRLFGALTVPRAVFAGAPQQKIKSIGLQLYTVRAALQADFDATLAQVAAIGYREVEFAGYFGHSAHQVRASLRRTGLNAPSAHIPLEALGNGWQGVIENALAIGHRYLVVASVGTVSDLDGYRRVAERFNQAGEVAKKAGLRFAYHNHDFEFAPLAGKIPYDVLLEATDPRYVYFEMDLYWITKAGGNPVNYFTRWPGRIQLVHVKDAAAQPPHRMTEVGAGMLDWRVLLGRAALAGVKYFFVEQDEASDPIASITASYAYLRDLRWNNTAMRPTTE
jgi:sugar phosphate isomerase/epimerase